MLTYHCCWLLAKYLPNQILIILMWGEGAHTFWIRLKIIISLKYYIIVGIYTFWELYNCISAIDFTLW